MTDLKSKRAPSKTLNQIREDNLAKYGVNAVEAVNLITGMIGTRRGSLNVRQEEFAQQLSISKTHLSHIENGVASNIFLVMRALDELNLLQPLFDAFGISSAELAEEKKTSMRAYRKPAKVKIGASSQPMTSSRFMSAINIEPEGIFPVLPRTAHMLRDNGYAIRKTDNNLYYATLPMNVIDSPDKWLSKDGDIGGKKLLGLRVHEKQYSDWQLKAIRDHQQQLLDSLNDIFAQHGLKVNQVRYGNYNEQQTYLEYNNDAVSGLYYQQTLDSVIEGLLEEAVDEQGNKD